MLVCTYNCIVRELPLLVGDCPANALILRIDNHPSAQGLRVGHVWRVCRACVRAVCAGRMCRACRAQTVVFATVRLPSLVLTYRLLDFPGLVLIIFEVCGGAASPSAYLIVTASSWCTCSMSMHQSHLSRPAAQPSLSSPQ